MSKATPPVSRPTRTARSPQIAAPATRRYGGLSADERRAGRRERLMDAAVRCFGTRGFAATTIEEICTAANVTARHFYEEFESREALLRATYDAISRELLDGMRSAIYADGLGIDDVVRRGAAAYFEAMTADERKARIVAVEVVGISPAFEGHRRRSIDAFAAEAARSTERLTLAGIAPTIDYRLLSVALIGAGLELTSHWVLAEERPTVEQLIDLVTSIWTRSLGLTPSLGSARDRTAASAGNS